MRKLLSETSLNEIFTFSPKANSQYYRLSAVTCEPLTYTYYCYVYNNKGKLVPKYYSRKRDCYVNVASLLKL